MDASCTNNVPKKSNQSRDLIKKKKTKLTIISMINEFNVCSFIFYLYQLFFIFLWIISSLAQTIFHFNNWLLITITDNLLINPQINIMYIANSYSLSQHFNYRQLLWEHAKLNKYNNNKNTMYPIFIEKNVWICFTFDSFLT